MRPVVAISMMHNEEDVVPYVVRHMLAECDAVIVGDHGSTDRTGEILAGIGDPRLTVLPIAGPYRQATLVNRLASRAGSAEWIVPFDADEWWTSPHGRIADVLRGSGEQAATAVAWLLVPHPDDDEADPNPFTRIRRRRFVPRWEKVAFRPGPGRLLVLGSHRLRSGPVGARGLLEIAHAPYRSFDQMARKVRHGKIALEQAPLSPKHGRHWRTLGGKTDAELAAFWANYTKP